MSEAAGGNESFTYLHSFPDPYATLGFSLQPLEDVLKDGLVVLDANVLLLPFKTGPHALEEIEKALEQLKDANRLFVPEHALREYLANRPHKIKEFYDQLQKRRSKDFTVPAVAKLIERVDSFKHLQDAEKNLKDEVEKFKDALGLAIEEVKQWTTNDPVSQIYKKLFSKEIVVELADSAATLEKEHKERNAKAIPPGYKDASKSSNNIGDFLVWKTILKIGSEHGGCNLIFVSGDEKPDWVYRSSGDILYAREELIEEYRRASGGGSFHLIDFATLLKYLKASDKAVAEVHYSEGTPATAPSNSISSLGGDFRWSDFVAQSEAAFSRYLTKIFGKSNIYIDGDVDFVVFHPGSKAELHVEVKSIRHYEHFKKRVYEVIKKLAPRIDRGPIWQEANTAHGMVAFVCETKEAALFIAQAVDSRDWPEWLTLESGYLENEEYVSTSPMPNVGI